MQKAYKHYKIENGRIECSFPSPHLDEVEAMKK